MRRQVRSLVALGDSSLAGIGDPLPDRSWRGAVPLLAAALQVQRVANLACPGARLGCVRERQMPAALSHDPDLAVVLAGMNDTLRGEFSAPGLVEHLDVVVGDLTRGGAQVILTRLHDHTRLVPLPPVWRRALQKRLAGVNAAVDVVAARYRTPCLDLDALPGVYGHAAWSIDRLHPSELGHRVLAAGFATVAEHAGWAVARPVSLACEGGRAATRVDHLRWLIGAGVPWLGRRSRDLLPHAASLLVRELLSGPAPVARPPILEPR